MHRPNEKADRYTVEIGHELTGHGFWRSVPLEEDRGPWFYKKMAAPDPTSRPATWQAGAQPLGYTPHRWRYILILLAASGCCLSPSP